MAKDAYWFKHDSTAGRGLRMRKMAHIHGHWGKGVYWDVIEILRDQSGYFFDYDDTSLQMLADLIGCKDSVKFTTWVRDCVRLDLFRVENNKRFFSPILCENMQIWEQQKQNGGKGGRPRKPKRNQKHNQTDNPNETIIGYNSIEQNITEENKERLFGVFKDAMRIYPGTKRGSETEFLGLQSKHKDWQKCVPLFFVAISTQSTARAQLAKNNQFVPAWKNFKTWINQRCWEEVISIDNKPPDRQMVY